MGLYNLSEFLTMLKEDIGIKDIPLPVDDKELIKRIENSALKEFSVRAPRIETFRVSDNERVSVNEGERAGVLVYKIPKWVYQDSNVLAVTNVNIARPLGYSDMYIPQGSYASPDLVLGALADIKVAATIAASMARALSWQFKSPDRVLVYNGWASGIYDVEIALQHDISLTTISPTAFTQFRELCMYDLEEFLYNKLKRIDNLDVGIGNIQLRIENWEDAGQKKRDLLKDWDDNGANLDVDNMSWF